MPSASKNLFGVVAPSSPAEVQQGIRIAANAGATQASSPVGSTPKQCMSNLQLAIQDAIQDEGAFAAEFRAKWELGAKTRMMAEVRSKLPSSTSKPTGGSSPDSDPRWPEHLLTCVNEEVEKLMAQMAQMAHAVQLNGMPQVHVRLKELEEVIERPAARRNVAQEDAENALYSDAMTIVNAAYHEQAKMRQSKKAMQAARSSQTTTAADWSQVDPNNATQLQQLTEQSMKNQANPAVKYLTEQIEAIDTQINHAMDDSYRQLKELCQLSDSSSRIEAKDYKVLKELNLDRSIDPDKTMKFLIWLESVLMKDGKRWFVLWPTLRKLMAMNKHLDEFQFCKKRDFTEKTREVIRDHYQIEPETIEAYAAANTELYTFLMHPDVAGQLKNFIRHDKVENALGSTRQLRGESQDGVSLLEIIIFLGMSKGSGRSREIENGLITSCGHFDDSKLTIKQVCAKLRKLVEDGREWKVRCTWAETAETWIRATLTTRGTVPGLDKFIVCPDVNQADDCIELLESIITTIESEVLKMCRNSDKSTKRKHAMDKDTVYYVSPQDASRALTAALGGRSNRGSREGPRDNESTTRCNVKGCSRFVNKAGLDFKEKQKSFWQERHKGKATPVACFKHHKQLLKNEKLELHPKAAERCGSKFIYYEKRRGEDGDTLHVITECASLDESENQEPEEEPDCNDDAESTVSEVESVRQELGAEVEKLKSEMREMRSAAAAPPVAPTVAPSVNQLPRDQLQLAAAPTAPAAPAPPVAPKTPAEWQRHGYQGMPITSSRPISHETAARLHSMELERQQSVQQLLDDEQGGMEIYDPVAKEALPRKW